jgi:hypothetical protein
MNTNQQYISAIKNALNRSTEKLDSPILNKLAHSRNQALLRTHRTHQFATEHSNSSILRLRAISLHHEARLWLGIAVIVICSIAAQQYWQHNNDDHSDIDIAILTDELPIDVYVD